jgi:ribosome biogenesis GTPase
VALDVGDAGSASVHAVLPRRTKISRRAADDSGTGAAREQVVAANVDVVFVAASLADDVDLRIVERYLTVAWESGARPVILLTKADLEEDAARVTADVAEVAVDVPVEAISARAGHGLDRVRSYLEHGVTGALVGPSGVGKSTIVNALAREELLETGSLSEDGAGRHTTTRRQLVVLPGGGLLVDNPGIRELHPWLADEGLEAAFADVVELFAHCRFANCSHETEPGCAVQAALADGSLAPERWESYRRLERELAELEERLAGRERSRAGRRRPGTGAS